MERLKQAVALAAKIQGITADVLARHIGRQEVVKATFLSLVSGRPAFFLGSPGVDKTGTIQALAGRIDGAVFYDALMPTVTSVEQLLVESTSIEELPTNGGGRQIRTRDELGRAAAAHLVFADEIWKAETRVLQTLIDLSKGDGVRHEGMLVKTPLLAFLAASNELPDPEGNLGAVWSRMTLRVVVQPLDRGGKQQLVQARLLRDRAASSGQSAQLTLDEIGLLRSARPHVEVPGQIVESVLDIYQTLVDESAQDFDWAWADDRRFGRVFDVMQANALLEGRPAVGKQDLAVLEWLLWDRPEQITIVKAKLAPYTRTPLSDARESVDALLSPEGNTKKALTTGDAKAGTSAITQCQEAQKELGRLLGEADEAMKPEIVSLQEQVKLTMEEIIAVVTGAKTPQGGN